MSDEVARRGQYPYFQEIINEMAARAQGALPGVAEADPVGILEETISPLLDACNEINLWIGEHKALPPRQARDATGSPEVPRRVPLGEGDPSRASACHLREPQVERLSVIEGDESQRAS